MASILELIVKEILAPILLQFIRNKQKDEGRFPTEEELTEEMKKIAGRVSTEGLSLLNRRKSERA